MITDYKAIEYRLHESLVQTQEMISLLGFDARLNSRIADCKNLLKTKKYNVAVMGEFKRGKSSLINALLGNKILPADVTPTTATINRITYASEPGILIQFKDGSEQFIEIDQLTDYVTKLTPEGTRRAALIREAVICYPTVICQNHVDIIDTPGLDDSPEMTKVTIDKIKDVDAVVVAISARSPFSATEKTFVCDLMESDNIGNLIFVVTFLDQLDEDDYVYGDFMAFVKKRIQDDVFAELRRRQSEDRVTVKAHRLLDDIIVHGISSKLALESFVSNNAQKREKSRFEAFYEYLLQNVTARQMEHASHKVLLDLKDVIRQFDGQNQLREKEWAADRARIDGCMAAAGNLRAALLKTLDGCFLENYEALPALADRIRDYKSRIIKEFIKELSSLRVSTHQAILNALTEAQKRSFRMVNDALPPLRGELEQEFSSYLSRLDARADSELGPVLAQLSLPEETPFAPVRADMEHFVHVVLSNVSFGWTSSPIPPVPDLTQCNVIETVTRAADASVNDLLKYVNGAIAAIRKNWFGQAGTYAEKARSAIMRAAEEALKSHTRRHTAYISNYAELSQKSSDIIQQCETLYDKIIG